MSVKTELNEVIKKMESDLESAKKSQQNPYLEEYGKGYVDGAVEAMESTIKFMKVVVTRLS